MTTGTPICDRNESVVLFQMIWRGRTTACWPRADPESAPEILHDNGATKYQTRQTFLVLLQRLARKLQERKINAGLHLATPAVCPLSAKSVCVSTVFSAQVLIVDNAPGHFPEELQAWQPPGHLHLEGTVFLSSM